MALLIGIGNPYRGDDAAGLTVARHVAAAAPAGLTVRSLPGDQLELIDAWEGHEEVYVVDAVWSGGDPGTVYRFDASVPLGGRFTHRGTHTFSLADVIELARALGRLPDRLEGYGIEGAVFALGAPLSAVAEAAARDVAERILSQFTAGRATPAGRRPLAGS